MSGDLWWRLSRGEVGADNKTKSFVFYPTEDEILNRRFSIQYNAGSDTYVRGSTRTAGFAELTFISRNMYRKVEEDWRMAYLARVSGTGDAEIAWKFDCSGSELKISRVRTSSPRATFHSGTVIASVQVDNEVQTQNVTENFVLELSRLATSIVFKVILQGGDRENALQHAQIFREWLDGPLEPFVFEIALV